jgi:hypothetical protein
MSSLSTGQGMGEQATFVGLRGLWPAGVFDGWDGDAW